MVANTSPADTQLLSKNLAMVPTDDSADKTSFHWHYGAVDDKNFEIHGRGLLLVIVVFSLVLFFAVICLYMRWACRNRSVIIVISSVDQYVDESGGSTAAQPVGLDKVAIESLPVKMHLVVDVAEEEKAQCSICLNGFIEGEKVKVMPDCEHCFHPECVDQWLRSNSTCPLCRTSVVVTPAADSAVLTVDGPA